MHQLDEKDRRIIEVLERHADFTMRQIAKKTLLPITTVHHRIKRLKEEQIIKRYTIELDHGKMGKGFVAYILITANLQLLKRKRKTQYDLAGEVRKLRFVERADIVSGGTDVVTVVRVKDVEEFDRVLLGQLQLIEGVDSTQSLIVIHRES